MMISGPAMEASDASASSDSPAENVSSCSGMIAIDHRPSVVAGFGLYPGTFQTEQRGRLPDEGFTTRQRGYAIGPKARPVRQQEYFVSLTSGSERPTREGGRRQTRRRCGRRVAGQ